MSRTIRRKGEKHHNRSGRSHFILDYITDSELTPGVEAWDGAKTVVMTGQEFWKGFYFFHGCTHRRCGWGNHKDQRQAAEVACRMANKRQMQRWQQDNDYEIFLLDPRDLTRDR